MSALEKAMEAEREATGKGTRRVQEVTRRVGEVADEWEKGLPFEFPLRPFFKVTVPSLVKGFQMKMQP